MDAQIGQNQLLIQGYVRKIDLYVYRIMLVQLCPHYVFKMVSHFVLLFLYTRSSFFWAGLKCQSLDELSHRLDIFTSSPQPTPSYYSEDALNLILRGLVSFAFGKVARSLRDSDGNEWLRLKPFYSLLLR